jgi:serine/threonine protein kinase
MILFSQVPHVRFIECESIVDQSSPTTLTQSRILKGIYRSDDIDKHCVLKVAMSTEEDQMIKLECEKDFLELITFRDINLERQKYLVNWFHPSSDFLSQDQIYFMNESGETIIPTWMTFPSTIHGLVYEKGGLNLKEFLSQQNHASVPVSQRIHILEEIVEAVRFLHKIGVVHFDLKPENIVCFTHTDQKTRWKIIDFDSCHDERSPTSSSGLLLRGENDSNLRLTEAYTSPEVAVAILDPSVELIIDWRTDIWSLGLVAFFLFTGQSFWSQHTSLRLSLLMISRVSQDDIHLILSKFTRLFGLKEKSFLECCLQVNPSHRKTTTDLLRKSLFQSCDSTVRVTNASTVTNDMLLVKIEEAHTRLNECHEFVNQELTSKFQDFYLCLTAEIGRRSDEEERER